MSNLRDNLELIEKQGRLKNMSDFIDFYSTAKTDFLACKVDKKINTHKAVTVFRIPGEKQDLIVCSVSSM